MQYKQKHENLTIAAIGTIEQLKECKIPFAGSLISAGFPSAIENFVENSLDLNDLLIKHPMATFFVRVIGNSMINAGIHSNDILIVDRSLSVAHNKIAVVRIADEFTVKRIHLNGQRMTLVAENVQYKPIEVTENMDVEIWGIVTSVIHQV
jgi:DNA polymerase V